jgi:hypothetical protein
MRVLYLDDIPTPYRLGIHRAFALFRDVRYKVLFCAAEEPGRQWEPDYSGIEYTILKGWQYCPPDQVNPFLLYYPPA